MSFNLTSLVLIGIALAYSQLAISSWRPKNSLSRFLAIMLGATVIIPFSYGMEIAVPDLAGKYSWFIVRHFGNALASYLVVLLVIIYSGKGQWLTKSRGALLASPYVLFFCVLLTNNSHHLFYNLVKVSESNGLTYIDRTIGPIGWAYNIFVYLFLPYVLVALGGMIRRSGHDTRRQTIIMIVGVTIPTITQFSYIFGFRPFGLFNAAPASFILTGLSFYWVINELQLIGLSPAARDMVFQHISIGVVVLDRDRRVLELNPGAQKYLDLPQSKAFGKPFTAAAAGWPELSALMENIDGQAPLNINLPRAADSREFRFEIAPLTDKKNRWIGSVILLRDVTHELQNEKELLFQQRNLAILEERERMARDLHDTTGQIMGYTSAQVQAARQNIRDNKVPLADAILARLGEITQDAHADLRSFILGLKNGRIKTLSFTQSLKGSVEQFSQVFGIPVDLSLPAQPLDGLLPLDGEIQLLRIVQEALTNTRKHAQASRAAVIITTGGGILQVEVTDDGVGFDPALPAAGSLPGNHLGLQIIRERAAGAGGSVEIRSAPGRGTRVIASLPMAAGSEPQVKRVSSLRALIVDDQPLFREGLRNLLTARGLTVVGEANDGLEALRLADTLLPDVVFMDINMPRMDGLQSLRHIKADHPEIKVVMLTVAETEENLLDALERGASGYLLKDLKVDDLMYMLEVLNSGDTPISPRLAARLIQENKKDPRGQEHPFTLKLSPQQVEILESLSRGQTYRQIAADLHITPSTVKYHTGVILNKLQVKNRAEAISEAARRGWLAE